jgi:hypothetical protein
VELLPGADVRAFVDIDSLLRTIYGHAKQGASYGFTKIAGNRRKGLSPLAATISIDIAAGGYRRDAAAGGQTGSAKGAGRMVAQAIATARAAGVTGEILVRCDSAYGTRAVIRACRRAGARFSLVLTKNPAVARAIATIGGDGMDAGEIPRCGPRPGHRRMDLRRRGRRDRLHRFRISTRSDHRSLDCAPCQRRRPPGGAQTTHNTHRWIED